MIYVLTHLGEPMPLPRPKVRIMAGRDGTSWPKFYLPAKARSRMNELKAEWGARPTLHGPLVCEATFIFARPASHCGTGRNAGVVKPSQISVRPGAGADLDNCVKLVLDALQGTAFANDGQIARIEAEKLYTDQAGVCEPQTTITLSALTREEIVRLREAA